MNEAAEMLRCLRPLVLWALLPWGLVVFWMFRATARPPGSTAPAGDSPWAGVVDARLLPHLLAEAAGRGAGGESPPPRHHPRSRRAIALLGTLLLLALSGPQIFLPGAGGTPPLRPDAARVLLVDLSPAFDALPDADRQRLRNNLRRFVHQLPAGETALVAAAGAAWLVVPPTEDVLALDGFLAELAAEVVPVAGDHPEQALALARQTLAASGSRQTAIYWLRLGPRPATELARAAPSGVAPIFLHPDGTVEQWLAQADADRSPSGWTRSWLNLAPPVDAGWFDIGPWLVAFSLPLAALLSRRVTSGLGLVLVLAGGALTSEPLQAADVPFAAGVAHYRAARYSEAAAAFALAPPGDPRAHYNRGNALARSGRLHAALAAYDESLRLRPGDASTRHNRDLVARLLQSPRDKPPPPPPPAPKSPPPSSPQSEEAARAAEQWLRRPPAGADGLLKRKLALEERRRQAGREP